MRADIQLLMIANYRTLMEEAKNRIGVLNVLLGGKTGLPPIAVQEFGFLQLRMLCELVALACLTAHGQIPETRELREEWHATTILKRIEKLHADFYPTPIKIEDEGPGRKHISPAENGSLAKSELFKLYRRCGDLLHKGSMNKLLRDPVWPADNAELIDWGRKLTSLISNHWIGHLGAETHLLCMLAPKGGGGVNVAFLSSHSEQPARSESRPPPVTLPGLHPSKPWKAQK
jgi:hypothetical protein